MYINSLTSTCGQPQQYVLLTVTDVWRPLVDTVDTTQTRPRGTHYTPKVPLDQVVSA